MTREEDGTEDAALGDTRGYWNPLGVLFIDNDPLGALSKVGLNPYARPLISKEWWSLSKNIIFYAYIVWLIYNYIKT